MRTMKGQVRGDDKQWIIINSVSGLSTRIKIDRIQEIQITANSIEIRIDGDKYFTTVKRYNENTIELRPWETKRFFKELHQGDDNYYEKGAKERHIREDQENERSYLESLDKSLAGKDWEQICGTALSREMLWLKDKVFDHLKQQLESLSDKFALNVKSKGVNHD